MVFMMTLLSESGAKGQQREGGTKLSAPPKHGHHHHHHHHHHHQESQAHVIRSFRRQKNVNTGKMWKKGEWK
jgi:hypothetical protein